MNAKSPLKPNWSIKALNWKKILRQIRKWNLRPQKVIKVFFSLPTNFQFTIVKSLFCPYCLPSTVFVWRNYCPYFLPSTVFFEEITALIWDHLRYLFEEITALIWDHLRYLFKEITALTKKPASAFICDVKGLFNGLSTPHNHFYQILLHFSRCKKSHSEKRWDNTIIDFGFVRFRPQNDRSLKVFSMSKVSSAYLPINTLDIGKYGKEPLYHAMSWNFRHEGEGEVGGGLVSMNHATYILTLDLSYIDQPSDASNVS